MEKFSLKDQWTVVTGGAGLLGLEHAQAILSANGNVILLDLHEAALKKAVTQFEGNFKEKVKTFRCDVSNEDEIKNVLAQIVSSGIKITGLINNATINHKVSGEAGLKESSRLENFDLAQWNLEITVGLTGALLCTKHFGAEIAKNGAGGSIINVSSDLGIIAPNQNLYSKPGLSAENQPVKPVTYSVIKSGLIGLTRYISTYWADRGVRCNALCPGGVFTDQNAEFVKRVSNLIPMGRMAKKDEYQGAITFLLSDASSYMNGAVLVIDGGRSAW